MLGKGSFAEVRSAEHKLAKINVAVKILKKTAMSEKQLERARSEIETLKLCQHPNIMRLYEVFENADNIYLVLEYLGGGSLYSFLKERHFIIPEAMARRFVTAIAHALHYMHQYGIKRATPLLRTSDYQLLLTRIMKASYVVKELLITEH